MTPAISGNIFNIESFSLHNGPGIRTTLFLKGCPLRCLWCANPESWNPQGEVGYNRDLCIPACAECDKNASAGLFSRDRDGKIVINPDCPRDNPRLKQAAAACPSQALAVYGSGISVGDAITLLSKDKAFYDESGGGVTLSGGEPLLQPEFTEALLSGLCERGIHTAVDTCGDAEAEVFARIGGIADLILFDFKEADAVLHKEWTGRDNRRILTNLEQAAERHSEKLLVRYPFIPGLNGTDECLTAVAKVLSELGIPHIDIVPYHRLGRGKYQQLGLMYPLPETEIPTKEEIARGVHLFDSLGIIARVIG